MGQKVNPVGLRLGIVRGWDSNWFGGKHFANKIVEDDKIRKYLNARLVKAGISKIFIERTLKLVTVTLNVTRPGFVIGPGGTELDKLKEELRKLTDKEVQINISEVKRPDLDAVLVAQNIARQIEGRASYRKAVKMAIENTMRSNAEGIKVTISGRVGGAEMARSEHFKKGRTPLHTLRADIDFSLAEAQTTYGIIGVKVWIFRGFVYGKRDLFVNNVDTKEQRPGGRPTSSRSSFRDGDRGDRRGGGGGRGRGGDGRGGDGRGRSNDNRR
ncbi:MAG: 30S ribosomal protein S3 [Bacteroidales bacterium]|jgi:small subunit ribosomal protein S3|nr:30S ribosomal protein S3 [Bacteroidales bacterium]